MDHATRITGKPGPLRAVAYSSLGPRPHVLTNTVRRALSRSGRPVEIRLSTRHTNAQALLPLGCKQRQIQLVPLLAITSPFVNYGLLRINNWPEALDSLLYRSEDLPFIAMVNAQLLS
jgi:hypothetical protein